MSLDAKIVGSQSGAAVDVTAENAMKVAFESDAYTNPRLIGSVRVLGEVDGGATTNMPILRPLEVDADYRVRVSQDNIIDDEVFVYTAQNTGKHNHMATTMAATWTAGQYTTNSGSITGNSTGTQLSTYAYFPCTGTTTLSLDAEISFSDQPKTNTFIEWGIGQGSVVTSAPGDGVFFRLNSAGLQGIASYNGAETSTGVFPLSNGTGTWVYQDNKRYQFICYQSMVEAMFWVNDGTGAVLLGRIPLPTAQPRMSMAASGQVFIKHRIAGGAASGSMQAYVGGYNVRQGGVNFSVIPSTSGNRIFGSYQGLSGGAIGSLANYVNNTNPVAAVPSNTVPALGVGLGGQFWETATLAVNTDGIITSYQNPFGSVSFSGRRLVIRGVGLTSYIQAGITGGPFVAQWSLAFGHTSVSLATAESASAKAPRRVPLAGFTQAVTAAQAVGTIVSQPGGSFIDFGDAPIFVNPGEYIQLVKKHVGTPATAGTIAHVVTFVFGWE